MHRPRRLAFGFKVYRLGKIGEDGRQFLLRQAEAAARRGERFGAVGRESIEVILDCGPVAAGNVPPGSRNWSRDVRMPTTW